MLGRCFCWPLMTPVDFAAPKSFLVRDNQVPKLTPILGIPKKKQQNPQNAAKPRKHCNFSYVLSCHFVSLLCFKVCNVFFFDQQILVGWDDVATSWFACLQTRPPLQTPNLRRTTGGGVARSVSMSAEQLRFRPSLAIHRDLMSGFH